MEQTAPTLLVIDDDPLVRRAVSRTLSAQGFRVLTAGDGPEGLDVLTSDEVDVALIDIGLPGMDGLTVLRNALQLCPSTECIIFTGQGNISTAYQSLDAGASDYFEKPIRDWQRFQQVLRRATQVRRLKKEKQILERRVEGETGILIGNSQPMVRLRSMVRSVATSSASILIVGESGVGKELVAEAIHYESARKGQFVRINCASVPPDLMESELFGWEKGAHSTATHSKPGLFEIAEDGTILLDEIAEMSYELQAKLLRVLENRAFRRLGGTREIYVNARVLAATNQNMDNAIATGRFRRDLYFRINVITIDVPPLRERREDVALLTYHFIKQFNETEERQVRRVSPALLAKLELYDWPGNVRELRNMLQRAVLLSTGDELEAGALDGVLVSSVSPVDELLGHGPPRHPEDVPELFSLDYTDAKAEVLQAFTRRYLKHHLGRAGGNITRAADSSGMLRPNFKRLMKRFGVEVPSTE